MKKSRADTVVFVSSGDVRQEKGEDDLHAVWLGRRDDRAKPRTERCNSDNALCGKKFVGGFGGSSAHAAGTDAHYDNSPALSVLGK